MIDVSSSLAPRPVAFLLHPSMVPVIDVFRSLYSLEDQFDLTLLDAPEQALATYVSPEIAKGVVSDALLLAFALTRQRGRSFTHRPVGSRHGTLDEYCLLALIISSRDTNSDVALEAAAFLDLVSLDVMKALAGELVRQIDLGALLFEPPSLAEFKAVMGYGPSETVILEETLAKAEFHFRQ